MIDGKGDQTAALMGTLMLSACKKRGLGGVIVDGAIRDKLELLELGFPVFSAGFNPRARPSSCPGASITPSPAPARRCSRRPRGGRCDVVVIGPRRPR
ncbi:dimethylmenaquinone methyltransferase [Alicycliphilus sp. B1]|nr:dimethylmenaquinone methyltransferase [Alicycliphilus sp. B1]